MPGSATDSTHWGDPPRIQWWREWATNWISSRDALTMFIWLVVWLPSILYFPIYWVANHPNWLIFFRGVAQPPTSCTCFVRRLSWPNILGRYREHVFNEWKLGILHLVVNDVDPVTVTADESKQFSLEKELESLVVLIYLLNTSAIHFKFTRSKWHLGYIVWATFGLHLGYTWLQASAG